MAELEHDPKLVERLALMNEGNAFAHLNRVEQQRNTSEGSQSRWSQHEMLAASGFAIAASYWSLIEPLNAVRQYRRAVKIYRSMGHSYWIVLALASGSMREIGRIPSFIEETRAPSPQAIAFGMIGNEVDDATDRQNMHSEQLNVYWQHVGNPPVGRLGIPLNYYVRCAQAMHAARTEENIERFLIEAASYVHRAAEVLHSASHDHFHWQRLQLAILPAEPEAVAVTTAMSIMANSVLGTPITEIPNLDSHGRLLVDIGESMWRNAALDDNERLRR